MVGTGKITIHKTDLVNDIIENTNELEKHALEFLKNPIHSSLKWIILCTQMIVQDVVIKALVSTNPYNVIKANHNYRYNGKTIKIELSATILNPVEFINDSIIIHTAFSDTNIEYFMAEAKKHGYNFKIGDLVNIYKKLYSLLPFLDLVKLLKKKKNKYCNDEIINYEMYYDALEALAKNRNGYIHFYPGALLAIEEELIDIIRTSIKYVLLVIEKRPSHFQDWPSEMNMKLSDIINILK